MKTLYHGNRAKTIEMLQEELFYMESYILVYGKYKTALDKVDCECLICGYKWRITPNSLLVGKGCENCAGSIKSSLSELQQRVDKLGKNMTLTGEYKDRHSPITCLCNSCGTTRTVSANALLNGACPGCSKRLPWSIESIKNNLIETNRSIELISTEYKNIRDALKFKCLVCLLEWNATWKGVGTNSNGCSNCALTGFKFLRPANLYYIRLSHENEVFYKIGISSKSTLKRYTRKEDLKIEVLYEFKFQTGQEAWDCEQNILRLFKDYAYVGPKLLNAEGNTEIFTRDILQMGHIKPMAVKDVK